VWQMDARVKQQKQENSQLDERNKALEAEVRDLKQGLEALEERARSDLGMIKKDETFFQVVEE
ncbi:MAG: septum formation initiator family protein, partial [Gammaproteobacteria bacterium]|nr:septum formation initiator family protein [Gammaproteobacteria bacterium]